MTSEEKETDTVTNHSRHIVDARDGDEERVQS